MPIINGKYYMNHSYGRHVEGLDGKPTSLAWEIHKLRGKLKQMFADQGETLLDLLPKADLTTP